MSGFVYYKTNDRKICNIVVFDDGNQSYQNVHNKWMILDVMFGGDKVKLKNFHRPEMILPSIFLIGICQLNSLE